MELLSPTLAVLNRFYRDPSQNLKLILSQELEDHRSRTRENKTSPGNDIHAEVSHTVYEVIRKDRLLGYVIEQLSGRKLKKIQDHVLILLKIGVFLLLFSHSHPGYAIVNEAVARARGKARGFVNAILRATAKQKTILLHQLEYIPDKSITYSMTPLLIERLEQISRQPQNDLAYLNSEPLFHIRVNTLSYSFTDVKHLLSRENLDFRELPLFSSFEIKESGRVIKQLLKKQAVYFQNTGSQFISILAASLKPQLVLDCCAAPGTKSITLVLLEPHTSIIANDIHPGRITLMKSFLEEFHIPRITPLISNSTAMPFHENFPFDLVIVDAPCTSSGTLRKNPDLKLKINEETVKQNAKRQFDILAAISQATTLKNTAILYSVCSFIKEETEDVLEHLMNECLTSTRFYPVNFEKTLETYGFNYSAGKYGYYLLPDNHLNNDMFYLSLLTRKEMGIL